MKNKILIIGDYTPKNADSCKWDGDLYNLIDYAVVIIDTSCLYKVWGLNSPGGYIVKESEISHSIEANFKVIRKKIMECLLIDTQIFVLFYPKSSLQYYSNYPYFHTNDWLPITINTEIERGTIFNLQNKTYQDYFKRLKSWKYYYLPKQKDDWKQVLEFYKPNELTFEIKEIALNKLSKPLAMEFIPVYREIGYGPNEQNSRIILLPTTSEDTSADIDSIISLTKLIDQADAPTWAGNINLPNESKLKNDLESTEIKLLSAKNNYNNLIKHKRLLYDNSYSLQDICEYTLKELGATIKPSLVSDEFIIEFNGKEALIEVKGKNKSIDKDDIGQLITDIGQHVATTGNSVKGLFIGNAWRNLPLKERESGNTRTFPKEIVHIAETQNIGLLSTTVLFNAYCNWLDGKLLKEKFLETLLTFSGIIKI